jgi:phosphoribosylformylglycinamidine cyclo-ligase
MARTFNCGIGMAVVVNPVGADYVTTELERVGEAVHRIGRIAKGDKGCTVSGGDETWAKREAWTATHHG